MQNFDINTLYIRNDWMSHGKRNASFSKFVIILVQGQSLTVILPYFGCPTVGIFCHVDMGGPRVKEKPGKWISHLLDSEVGVKVKVNRFWVRNGSILEMDFHYKISRRRWVATFITLTDQEEWIWLTQFHKLSNHLPASHHNFGPGESRRRFLCPVKSHVLTFPAF